MTADAALLDVDALTTRLTLPDGRSICPVDEVSFRVHKGAAVGLVGESGSGKSVTALSLMRLLPRSASVVGGRVDFLGRDLAALDERHLRQLRGNQLAMVFQEPMTALNPVMTTGAQVAEPLIVHRGASRKQGLAEAVSLFRKVGIADPERRVHEYPHQMSGGMRQRVMIAMALACKPALLIADEPTTALDVTIQAQILELLDELRRELHMGLILITHDLGVVAQTCDEVVVMYAGQVVERARTLHLFRAPRHPYTAGLLRSMPGLTPPVAPDAAHRRARLPEIAGMVPRLDDLPRGCRFAARCPDVQQLCRDEAPALTVDAAGDDAPSPRAVRCFFPRDARLPVVSA